MTTVSSLHEEKKPDVEISTMTTGKETIVTMWTLSATVLRAENIHFQDHWSDADCYVTLRLPSTSIRTYKTKAVANKQNPEWNETFIIRIHKNLRNILEIVMYDEDPMKPDNLVSSMVFDVNSLTVGKKETKEFVLKDKVKLFLALELQRREEEIHVLSVRTESVYYWTLNVTVLRARIKTTQDYWSQADCYAILSLPTATARTCRTKTVSNNNNPEWNEKFTFRVPKDIKNIIELKLYDEDPLKHDDLISTLLLDIESLTVGEKEIRVFPMSTEADDELEVEFELLESAEPNCEYLSNGILVGGPFSALDVNVDNLRSNDSAKDKLLKLRGACVENHALDSHKSNQLRFFINRDLETELGVVSSDADDASAAPMVTSVKLQPLQANMKEKVSLNIDKDTVDLELHVHESEEERLAVRLQSDIPPQEKEFLKKRKAIVGQALQKLLNLKSPPEPNKVPTIALVGSGGGTRAMTGLLGSLKGLKDLGMLDAVTYITGVSGSTWAMSYLYQDDHWSQEDTDSFISEVKEEMTKDIMSCFSKEQLTYYKNEITLKGDDGYIVTFIDMWGLVIEQLVFGRKITSTLSDQQNAVSEGQNPLPIYCAVNMKDGITGCEAAAEWSEFTPYEVGIHKYGAFVRAEDFGSQFFLGHIIKKLPQIRLPYLMGIWSSVFSINLTQLWKIATGRNPSWTPWLGPDVSLLEVDTDMTSLDTYILNPITDVGNVMTNIFKDRPVIAEMYNFMRGLFLHWNYSKNSNFTAWKETHPDAFPNKLTPSDATLRLVDSGHAINIGCAPVLRRERDVDIIISLSYSWDPQHIFNVISKTAAYCEDHDIPFPSADYASLEKEPQREIYIFEDKENPETPIVIHLPIGNITFKQFKHPGKPRETKEEIMAGQVDVSSRGSPYTTKNLTYSKEDFQALVDLTTYNISNNKDLILETIRKVMERKAAKE